MKIGQIFPRTGFYIFCDLTWFIINFLNKSWLFVSYFEFLGAAMEYFKSPWKRSWLFARCWWLFWVNLRRCGLCICCPVLDLFKLLWIVVGARCLWGKICFIEYRNLLYYKRYYTDTEAISITNDKSIK